MTLRVPVTGLAQGLLLLDEETSRYLVKVHRQALGSEVEVFDPVAGLVAAATIDSDRLPQVRLLVREQPQPSPRHDMPVTLVSCVGKADKPEQALRDVTALGAERLVLVSAQRSVARADAASRSERLMRVGEQVARQCGRGRLPEVRGPMALGEYLSAPDRPLLLVCSLDGAAMPLLALADQLCETSGGVAVIVGPEGGLSPDEEQACRQAGCQPIALGPYVLRAEVATAAVLSILRAVFLMP